MIAKNVIFLFLPAIIKHFKFANQEKTRFTNLISIIDKTERINVKNEEPDYWFNLTHNNCQQKLNDLLNDDVCEKIVIINYPRNLEHFQEIKERIVDNKEVNVNLVIVNITDFNLVDRMLEEYVICPFCESIVEQSKIEDDKFTCATYESFSMNRQTVKEFSKNYVHYYLENNQKVVSEFLKYRLNNQIIQLDVSTKEEITEDGLQKRILAVVSGIGF